MAEAIYTVEFGSISRGIGALDNMCKRAGLAVLFANPVCIGKYLICAGGDVADMLEAQAAAEPPDDTPPAASCLITCTHPDILKYFRKTGPRPENSPGALGIFETRTVAKGILSLDAALKAARAELLRVWLATQLGGKLCWVLGGGVSDIHSAVDAAKAKLGEKDIAGSRVVVAPSPELIRMFIKDN